MENKLSAELPENRAEVGGEEIKQVSGQEETGSSSDPPQEDTFPLVFIILIAIGIIIFFKALYGT